MAEAVPAAGVRSAGVRSVRDVLASAAATLDRAGCDTPRLDAELLLASVLGVDRARLVTAARDPVSDEAFDRCSELVARRSAREPVAYILGQRAFRRIVLSVDRRVLIPRPETELLVEVGLELADGARVVDVGTGSGAVALALKDERPDLRVIGTDISEDAIAVARDNGARLGLDVEFCSGDLLSAVGGPLHAVLANLPYVETAAALPVDVAGYEPAGALFAGEDGLDVVRRLVSGVDDVRVVALEVGAGQAPAVAGLLRAAGFAEVQARRDLAGIERVVVGRRS